MTEVDPTSLPVERVTLILFTPDATETQVEALMEAFRPFKTFEGVIHYAFGPLTESTSGEWDFGLYSRFTNRAALDHYLSHKSFLDAIEENFRPVTQSSMSLNWVSEIPIGVSSLDIKAVHLKFYRMKEGMEDLSKMTIIGALPVMMTNLPKSIQVGCGRNFESSSKQLYHWAFALMAESLEDVKVGTQSDDIISWKEGLLAFSQTSLVADFSCNF